MMAQMIGRPPKKETPATAPKHAAAVAVNLKRAREALGETQQHLADRLNMAQNTISELERGLANPSLRILENVAEAVGLTLEELVAPKSESVTDPESTSADTGSRRKR
jgi:transcriptional regulator with XRE-family HTH domain